MKSSAIQVLEASHSKKKNKETIRKNDEITKNPFLKCHQKYFKTKSTSRPTKFLRLFYFLFRRTSACNNVGGHDINEPIKVIQMIKSVFRGFVQLWDKK